MEKSIDMEDIQLQFENGTIFSEEYRTKMVRLIIKMFEKHLNYTFVQYLGNGAFGDVVELLNPDGRTSVAMKVILKEHQCPMEVSMWPQFSHKNVQSVIEDITIEPSETRVYLMTRQMGTLSHTLQTNWFRDFPDTLSLIKIWLTDVLEGLNYLHEQSICHLDIKSANVLISYEMRALLSDFSTIQSTEHPAFSYGAPILHCPPETCPSRRFRKPVEGTSFDLWTVGMLALNMLTGNYIQNRFTSVRSWIDDVYPLIFEAIEENKFLSLVKTAHPSSCVDKEIFRDMRNFVLSFLTLEPDDRPSAQCMLGHAFLKSGSYRFIPERIWINRVSSEQLKMIMTILDDSTRIKSDTKAFSDGNDPCKNNGVSEESCISIYSSVQPTNVKKGHPEIYKVGENDIESEVGEEGSEFQHNKIEDTNIVSDNDLNADDMKDNEERPLSVNVSQNENSRFVVVKSDSQVGEKNIESTDIQKTLYKDFYGIEINQNLEIYPSGKQKTYLKEVQTVSHSSEDSSMKSNIILIAKKSDDKVFEKQLITEVDADESLGVELKGGDTSDRVEEYPESDNTGFKRKSLCRRIRGWFRKRWAGVKKSAVCGFK